MGNGGRPHGPRGTVDRGTLERGVEGARLNDRATSRSTRSRRAAALPPAAPGAGQPDPRLTRIENVRVLVQRRNQLLSELTLRLRAGAPSQFASRSLQRTQAELNALERAFRGIMRRYQSNPRPLSAADRRAALEIFDDAFELSHAGWDQARKEFWRGLYNSPEGGRLVRQARDQGILQITDAQMRAGSAPRILDFNNDGSRRYVYVDIDHMVPRERNPFCAFDPNNLHLQTQQFNRRYLNPFSEATPFPMGRYGAHDDIEEFVQAHQLSRRQRPEPVRPRSRRGRRSSRFSSTGRIVGLLAGFAAVERYRSYTEAAESLRRAARARPEARRLPPIHPDDVDAFNVESKIESVYLTEGIHPRSPVEVDLTRAQQLRVAVQRWLQREYRPNGRGWREFESRLIEARNRHDVDALNRLLDEVGHVQMQDLSGIVLGNVAQRQRLRAADRSPRRRT